MMYPEIKVRQKITNSQLQNSNQGARLCPTPAPFEGRNRLLESSRSETESTTFAEMLHKLALLAGYRIVSNSTLVA